MKTRIGCLLFLILAACCQAQTNVVMPNTGVEGGRTNSSRYDTIHALCQGLRKFPPQAPLLKSFATEMQSETNASVKFGMMVCSALLGLVTGDGARYKTAVAQAVGIYPDGAAGAPRFEEMCDNCQACDGSGRTSVACGNKWRDHDRCDYKDCNGTGRIHVGNINPSCPNCKGTGKCPNCGGTGQTTIACSTCKGKGQILSHEKVIAAYGSALDRTATMCYSEAHPEMRQVQAAANQARESGSFSNGDAVPRATGAETVLTVSKAFQGMSRDELQSRYDAMREQAMRLEEEAKTCTDAKRINILDQLRTLKGEMSRCQNALKLKESGKELKLHD